MFNEETSTQTAFSPSIDDIMRRDPRHHLSANSPANDIGEPLPEELGMPVHLHDLVFQPRETLVIIILLFFMI